MFEMGILNYHLYPAWEEDQEIVVPKLVRSFSLNKDNDNKKEGEEIDEKQRIENEKEMLKYYFTRYETLELF